MQVARSAPASDLLDSDPASALAALAALDLGVFEYDLVRGHQRFSATCKRLWGLAPDEEADAERIASMVHPEDRHALAVAYASLQPDGPGQFAVEHRIVRADGAVRWLQVRGQTVFDTAGGTRRALRSAGTMLDVTELRTRGADRRAAEVRHAFMMTLEDRIRSMWSPKHIKFEAARLLARGLGVERVGYAEDAGDGSAAQVANCYADGLETLRGSLRYDAFGADVVRKLRAGEMLVRSDVPNCAQLGDAERAAYAAIGTAATVNVPLLKKGRLVAVLFVHSKRPRAWTADEMALVAAVAHRTWEAVERARAERIARHTQRELRARSERLRLFIEHAPAAIAMLDREMRYIAVSRRFVDDFQLPEGDLVGRSHYEVFPELPQRWKEVHARCLAGATEESKGEPFVRANGLVQWVKWEVRPWQTARGAIGGVLLFTEDITERQQYETRLRESAARLRLAFEAAGMSPWRADLRANRFEASEGAVALHGLQTTDEAWTIENASRVIHPEDRARVYEALAAAAREGRSCKVEYRTVWPDGTVRWVANAARGELDERGQPTGRVLGTVRDVSLEHEAVDRIAASEARLRMTLEAARAGAWELDLRTRRVRWAPETFELTGMTPTDSLDLDAVLRHIDPRDSQAVRASIESAVANGDPAFRVQYRVQHPRRGQRWLLGMGRVQRDAGGVPTRMLGLTLDVTAQKELEEALRRAHRQKDRFIATLSHELRNPLAPIRTAAHVLASSGLSEDQLVWARQVIQRQVGHMALLLDDLLDLARITQGKLVLKKELVPLHAIVDASVEAAQPLLERKRHELVVALPDDGPLLEADPLRLAQVFSNLLTNAAKYTDGGGHIALRAYVRDAELHVEVEDDGIGIDPEAMEHLFEMFSQVRDADARSEGGLGIGLALVRGLVELHGGTIAARSAGLGRGTTFVVRLPLPAPVANAPLQSRRETQEGATRPTRVLVVDDNHDGADTLALLLGLQGHEVRVAYGGRSGLALATAFQPEVAFLDLGMPDMDGCALARAIRARPGGANVRLIALTGWGQDEDKRRTEDAGFDAHLTKPIDPERIETLLASLPRA